VYVYLDPYRKRKLWVKTHMHIHINICTYICLYINVFCMYMYSRKLGVFLSTYTGKKQLEFMYIYT